MAEAPICPFLVIARAMSGTVNVVGCQGGKCAMWYEGEYDPVAGAFVGERCGMRAI